MTLDKLLELAESLPVADLLKLTEQETELYFAPFYNVTRPTVEKEERIKATLALPTAKKRETKASKIDERMKTLTVEQREKLAELQARFKI